MSFFNPVNEPVKRFSSTDADAPQINYAARTAGDVKAVLKACLVTGYGTTASAGWSVVNEVDHVAEFVSPSAAMSDYRLGIDDSSASSMVLRCTYQAAIIEFGSKSIISKTPSSDVSTSSPKNRWELLVTARGFWFVQGLFEPRIAGLISHNVYFGQSKSAVLDRGEHPNVLLFSAGALNPPLSFLREVFTKGEGIGANIGGYTKNLYPASATQFMADKYGQRESLVQVISEVFIISKFVTGGGSDTPITDTALVAQIPGVMLRTNNNIVEFVVSDEYVNNRPMLVTQFGRSASADKDFYHRAASAAALIYLDYWEY